LVAVWAVVRVGRRRVVRKRGRRGRWVVCGVGKCIFFLEMEMLRSSD
jgi:hypothetical protein